MQFLYLNIYFNSKMLSMKKKIRLKKTLNLRTFIGHFSMGWCGKNKKAACIIMHLKTDICTLIATWFVQYQFLRAI